MHYGFGMLKDFCVPGERGGRERGLEAGGILGDFFCLIGSGDGVTRRILRTVF